MRSKLVLLFIAVVIWQSAVPTMANWMPYAKGLKLAAAKKKPLMLYFYREGCHYCEYMETWVFSDKRVEKYMNSKFVTATIDLGSKQGLALSEKLQVYASPTILFIKPGKPLKIRHVIVGSMQPDNFFKELKRVCTKLFKGC